MKLGDYLLDKGYINKKQLHEALAEQSEQSINYNKPIQIGKILIEKGFVTVDEISEALNGQMKERKEEKTMATEIGEGSKFTFDLKFMATMAAIIISACGTYFSIMGSINDLKSADSPSRLEYSYLNDKVMSIESNGDLKLITYQLDEFKKTFDEIKSLSSQLSPLASDLDFIKKEIDKLKNKTIPEVDLSGIEIKLDNLSKSINSLEERITVLEQRKPKGGRF